MKKIYLDYAATTPVSPQVAKAMKPWLLEKFGNPSSLHSFGRQARVAVEEAREKAALALGAKAEEIIFTSGATEANNLAICGLVEKMSKVLAPQKPHLIVSPIEHHAVSDTVHHLEKNGEVEVSWLGVDKRGLVNISEIEKKIKDKTVLVSVMYGNNEVGTIEPIAAIGKLLQKKRRKNLYFHTDAVQAFQYLNCNVNDLRVDLLCLSAHKFYGPKGVGLLYVRKGTPVARQQDGGAQERNLRAGTENVAGIVGMGEAIVGVALKKTKEVKRLKVLQKKLIKGVLENVKGAVLTGDPRERLPHIVSFVVSGVEGESMLLWLDEKGMAVSSGSACTSGLLEPSHVLTAMGYSPEISHGSLRVSLGSQNTKEDIYLFIKTLPGIVEKLRKIAPDLGKNDKVFN